MGEHYYNTRGMLPRISANAQLFLCVLACGIFIASGDETIAALNKIYTEASADHTAFFRTYHAALLAQKGFEKSLAAEEQMVAPMEAEIAAPQVAAQQVMAPQGEAPQVMSAQMAVPASMMQRSHMPHSDPMDGGANRYWQSSKAVPHQPKKQPTAKQWKDLNYLGENPRDTQGQHSSLPLRKPSISMCATGGTRTLTPATPRCPNLHPHPRLRRGRRRNRMTAATGLWKGILC